MTPSSEAVRLINQAIQAREESYSPYSNFRVGAAILTAGGRIFTGCNVENASYGGTICAERTAAVKAVSAGERIFQAIAVVGYAADCPEETRGFAYPCGICRQFLAEFAHDDMTVYLAVSAENYTTTSLSALFPHAFGPDALTAETD